jgi:phospholipid/cholesterol/gamma-HCH transport system substrate-binding protein
MRRSLVETLLGATVLIVAVGFLFFTLSRTDSDQGATYPVEARFFSADGISTGSDVRVNGIRVGSVADVRLDTETFEAVVGLRIGHTVRLPTDTVAVITSDGLLGGSFVNLRPGTSTGRIEPDGRIVRTESQRSIEELVGEIIFLATDR